jgi:hypothetical protein
MATLASLTLNVEEMLLGVAQIERPWEDSLATGVTDAADLEWRMTSYASWKKNDYAEVLDTTGTADEVVILDENHPNGADVTVRRAQRGTTAHSGAIAGGVGLRKNPPYPRVTIARFINDTINTMLWPGVWYRSRRSLIFDGTASYYPLAAADFDVEEVFQLDLTGETVGDATVNAGTDLWTSTAHGLVVGDHVRFTVSGGGATGYAIDTDYWVLTAPTADTFTLGSTSAATTPVDATANSTNAWTLERRFPSLHPFQRGWFAFTVPTLMWRRCITRHGPSLSPLTSHRSLISLPPFSPGVPVPCCWGELGPHRRGWIRSGQPSSSPHAPSSTPTHATSWPCSGS